MFLLVRYAKGQAYTGATRRLGAQRGVHLPEVGEDSDLQARREKDGTHPMLRSVDNVLVKALAQGIPANGFADVALPPGFPANRFADLALAQGIPANGFACVSLAQEIPANGFRKRSAACGFLASGCIPISKSNNLQFAY